MSKYALKTRVKIIKRLIIVSTISIFCVAHAYASPIVIKINDLDLSRPEGAVEFEHRLKDVVHAFCDAERGMSEHAHCQEAIRAEALDQLSRTQRERLDVAEAGAPTSVLTH